MAEHFNKLTPAEAERLAYLIEELAEAQHAACKILRHGYESFNPNEPRHPGNRADLTKELNDVASAIKRMIQAGDLTSDPLGNSYAGKGARYMHHQD